MTDWKRLYTNASIMLAKYQDEIVPGLREQLNRKWIPVTERLPDSFGTFLVAIDEVHGENRVSVDAADFDPFEKRWSTFNYFCAGYEVTHWMPLPEPPKEVER